MTSGAAKPVSGVQRRLGWPGIQIARHPLAPMYNGPEKPQDLLQEALTAMTGGGGLRTTESVRQLLRQTGLVSLWFYLKFIAGYAGPYDKLNDGMHVDMCNFRQRVATTPGIKAAMFYPRSGFKTTVGSHGANGWELLRDPNLRIGCTSEIADRAQSFVDTTIATFKSNELHQWLYPEWKKANRDDTELVLANRTKRYVEPNLKAITAGGSTQGIHVDLFDADDIVGENMLNADRASTADMVRMGNWLHSNMRTLVVSWKESRVLVIGTRYAIDDPYERIMVSSKEHLGYWDDEDYDIDPNGEWVTQYWPAMVNGESIWPEVYDEAALAKMVEENPWLYYTQYMNSARPSKPGDFGQCTPGKVSMVFEGDEFWVLFPDGTRRPLSTADLVSAGDPAASTHRAGQRTSKSATTVVARWKDDVVAILELNKGYVEPTRFFDWLYDYKAKYGVGLRSPYVEAQAGFKSFIPIARQEALRRGKELNVIGVPALGNKETTIRNIIQPFLARGKLYVRDAVWREVMEELRVFPSVKMDGLDAIKIAIFKSHRPDIEPDGSDEDDEDDEVVERRRKVNSLSGY